MKIQTKMLKKFISILCAATMVASGAVVSVGASGHEEEQNKMNKVLQGDNNNNKLSSEEGKEIKINAKKENEKKKKKEKVFAKGPIMLEKEEKEEIKEKTAKHHEQYKKDMEYLANINKEERLKREKNKKKGKKANKEEEEQKIKRDMKPVKNVKIAIAERKNEINKKAEQEKLKAEQAKKLRKITEINKAIDEYNKEISKLEKRNKKHPDKKGLMIEKYKRDAIVFEAEKLKNNFQAGKADDLIKRANNLADNLRRYLSESKKEEKEKKKVRQQNEELMKLEKLEQKRLEKEMSRASICFCQRIVKNKAELIKLFKDNNIEIDDTGKDIENKIENIEDINKLEKIERELNRQIIKEEKEEEINSLKRDILCRIYLIKDIKEFIKYVDDYSKKYGDLKSLFAEANDKEDIKNEIKHIFFTSELCNIKKLAEKQIAKDRTKAMFKELGLEPGRVEDIKALIEFRELALKKCEDEIKKVENKREKGALARREKLQSYLQEMYASLEAWKAKDKLEKLREETDIAEAKYKEALDKYAEACCKNNHLKDKYANMGIVDYFQKLQDRYKIARFEYNKAHRGKGKAEEERQWDNLQSAKHDLEEAVGLQAAEVRRENESEEAYAKYDEVRDKYSEVRCEYNDLVYKAHEILQNNNKAYIDNQISINKLSEEVDNYCNNLDK